jgi:hypothetical protein
MKHRTESASVHDKDLDILLSPKIVSTLYLNITTLIIAAVYIGVEFDVFHKKNAG